jgi:enterobactin synthetase component D / holo-[acyl-carrier protein] synthase
MELSAEVVRRGFPMPVGVGVRAVGGPVPGLYPIEEEGLGPRAIAERRTLFALGRAAARDALRELGVEACAIPRAGDGAPAWPEGVVGTISHTRSVAIAVVGRRADYVGIGVDIEELDRRIREDITRLVCRPAEMDWVRGGNGTDRLLMLFSAKESIFKALYPIERVWLGFSDAEVAWEEGRGLFRARVLKSFGSGYPQGFSLEVRCTVGQDWVLTAAHVTASTG